MLCRRWGHPHKGINAGTGALGAISGVFLLDQLVLAHHPRLCLVEYATYDVASRVMPPDLGPAIEGIVEKLAARDCLACFVYLYRDDVDFSAPNNVIATYEAVAEHHGIPAIDLTTATQAYISSATADSPEVLRDVVHTTPAGSELVAQSIAEALEVLIEPHRPRPRPAHPLNERSFRNAHVVPADTDLLRDPERGSRRRFRLVYDYVEVKTDTCFECRFDAELVGLLVVIGPAAGEIRVTSGDDQERIMLWDEYCYYDRLSTAIFSRPKPAGELVRIELTDTPIDRSSILRPVDGQAIHPRTLRVAGFMLRE